MPVPVCQRSSLMRRHSTAVRLRSSWPHPSFSGAFLPAHYKLDAKGFDASWQILEVNRDYPQRWSDGDVAGDRVELLVVVLFQVDDAAFAEARDRNAGLGIGSHGCCRLHHGIGEQPRPGQVGAGPRRARIL